MEEIEKVAAMRADLFDLLREHPELDEFVEEAYENLWAIQKVLEIEEEDDDEY
ncbi:MAG: hypothetical protein ACMUIG_00480 [Thermoplasmatota archaeon]